MPIEIVFQTFVYFLLSDAFHPLDRLRAERAASGVRQLKTPYRATMGDKRESDLNFLQLQRMKKVDPEEVSILFIDLHKRRLFNEKITALRLCLRKKKILTKMCPVFLKTSPALKKL